MPFINFQGSIPTRIQQFRLEMLQASARNARLSNPYFPRAQLERTDFANMSPAQGKIISGCHTVTTPESLQSNYEKSLAEYGGGKQYLDDGLLRTFITIEAAKDLNCEYYRKFFNLEPQTPLVSPDQIAEFAFLKTEAMYYAEILAEFQKTHSGGRFLSEDICQRFGLDYKAQREPKGNDIYFSNIF